ncbi:ubiquitin-conjugating enzyme/RWD-like protein [Lipomyces oligophaga]|uniref:ubiquitin-conjugating enzyme/RWD-like protein n=1 Tax=Lipomyces oligophaga TaxID=45792 RepID=UPI0034CD5EFE
MNSIQLKRIRKEMLDISKVSSETFTAGPKSDADLLNWEVKLYGPKDTPYEGGEFLLDLILPPGYPFHPPTLKFVTDIFHPNVLPGGAICIPMLKTDQWKPACKLLTIIDIAVNLLAHPSEEDAIEGDAADLYKRDRQKYEKTAREWTTKYATPS